MQNDVCVCVEFFNEAEGVGLLLRFFSKVVENTSDICYYSKQNIGGDI